MSDEENIPAANVRAMLADPVALRANILRHGPAGYDLHSAEHIEALKSEAVAQVESKLNDALAELEKLRTEHEIAVRDAGLYAATLQLSASALGCETHMVDHAVKELLAELERVRADLLDAEAACAQCAESHRALSAELQVCRTALANLNILGRIDDMPDIGSCATLPRGITAPK